MSLIERLRNTEVSTRTAAVCLGVLILAMATIVLASRGPDRVKAPTQSLEVSSKSRAAVSQPGTSSVRGEADTSHTPIVVERASVPSDQEDLYAVIVNRNLFRAVRFGSLPASPTAGGKRNGKEEEKKHTGPPPSGKFNSIEPLPIPGGSRGVRPSGGTENEFMKSLAFTGVVDSPAGRQALLENITSKETRFVGKGENAFGCRVIDFDERRITVEKDGDQFVLNIGENKPDVESGTKAGGGGTGSGSGSAPGDSKPVPPKP
ncbi:MAG: hypothetical protein K6U00_11680 [Armatimonadetes bacterium]|nr:hypothetical protein [Armatimonadota bacterium]